MLKWASKSSSMALDEGRSSNSDAALMKFANAGCSLDISDQMENVHITPEKDGDANQNSPSSSDSSLGVSSWRFQDDVFDMSSSPRSMDSGMGGSKVSLENASKSLKSKSKKNNRSSSNNLKRRESHSMLWEEEFKKNERGCSSFCSLETLYEYLSLSSFMITLPCVLQFPLLTLKHGGAAFIIVYTILLLILILPTALLQLLFSGMSKTNPVSIWAKFVPVSAGVGPGLVVTSILCSSVTLVDTVQSLLYTWSSFRHVPQANIVRNQQHEHFMKSPFFAKMNQMHQSMKLNLSEEEAPKLDNHTDSLLLVESLTAGAILLIMTLFLKRSLLRYLQCFLQASVVILMVAMLIHSASLSTFSLFSTVLSPDWSKMWDFSTWGSAAMLAVVSTNLHTGVFMTISRERSSDHNGVTLFLATFSHLLFCVVMTHVLFSFTSVNLEDMTSRESVLVMIKQSVPSGNTWHRIILITIFLLGVASILSKLMVPLTYIEDKRGHGAWIKKIGLILAVVMLSLMPYFPETEDTITHLETWGVEISSLIVASMTLITIVWCYGITRMMQKLASRKGEFSLSLRITVLQLMGNIGLVLFLSFAGMAIFTRTQEKNDLIGPIIASSVIATVIVFSIIGVCIIGRRERTRSLSWKDYFMEIVGRRSREDRRASLTNSYRKFERCDMTMTNMLAKVHLTPRNSESGTYSRKTPSKRK